MSLSFLVILESEKSDRNKVALAGIIVGAIACVLAVLAILIAKKRGDLSSSSRRKRSPTMPIKIEGLKAFSLEEMVSATSNFSTSAEVGRGGYGIVYRGILLDKTVVAIKRAKEGSLQGQKEFFTEIELLSRLHHRNLVSLVGYCNENGEQMLIYEFMPNGTLRDYLSANLDEPSSFSMRLKIALGSAKGILYLHTEADPPIFHRDIKASNILLDSKFTAKVADFGLSRLAPEPDCEGVIPGHISTIVKGTPGYLDPEYFLTRKLTDKSDVYSLGVVFLELLTGMHPIYHGKNIVREVTAASQSGVIFAVIDNRIGYYPSDCFVKFMELALRCCQDETDLRPSMLDVVRELESICRTMAQSDSVSLELKDLLDTEEVNDVPISIPNSYQYFGEIMTSSSSVSLRRNRSSSLGMSGSDLVSDMEPAIHAR